VSNDASGSQHKVTLHVTIDEYQQQFIESGDGDDLNVSELTRACLDAIIPATKRPEEPPDRDFDVEVAYDGPLSELPQTNGTQSSTDK